MGRGPISINIFSYYALISNITGMTFIYIYIYQLYCTVEDITSHYTIIY